MQHIVHISKFTYSAYFIMYLHIKHAIFGILLAYFSAYFIAYFMAYFMAYLLIYCAYFAYCVYFAYLCMMTNASCLFCLFSEFSKKQNDGSAKTDNYNFANECNL